MDASEFFKLLEKHDCSISIQTIIERGQKAVMKQNGFRQSFKKIHYLLECIWPIQIICLSHSMKGKISNDLNSRIFKLRLLEESYGDIRIFSERPYGYKRYIVDYSDGHMKMFSGLWYKLDKVKELVEKEIAARSI